MSRGIGGKAIKHNETDLIVTYQYGSYNLNDPKYHNDEYICDGTITIEKNGFCLDEVSKLLSQGKIKVVNCSNCWMKSKHPQTYDIDPISIFLLCKLARKYDSEKIFPDRISYDT